MAKTLDQNEAAYLAALEQADPQAENWLTHYASGLNLGAHGADTVACSYEGSYSVMKNLIRRGLVDRDQDGRLNHHTGVAINDAGREALAARKAA